MGNPINLSLHNGTASLRRDTRFGQPGPVIVLGEVLWDVFPTASSLGGAPLNFAVHTKRLGYRPILISAVGSDGLGVEARRQIAHFGLDVSMVASSPFHETGTASVEVDGGGQPRFRIQRPAAYDDLRFTDDDIRRVQALRPNWLYYGTLYPSRPEAKAILFSLFDALPDAIRFYDVNLRPGSDRPELVRELIMRADVLKLNESEAVAVAGFLDLPPSLEEFCARGAERFGWRAICVTLGERGCAMFDGAEFVSARACSVRVVDTVGAGDAFAAAFMHGLAQHWPLVEIASLANRVGALVASRAGAIPEWSLAEASAL